MKQLFRIMQKKKYIHRSIGVACDICAEKIQTKALKSFSFFRYKIKKVGKNFIPFSLYEKGFYFLGLSTMDGIQIFEVVINYLIGFLTQNSK